MADDEELDTQKLDDLKNALDDLKIVDVARKPEGLSADLKATKSFATDMEAMQSLVKRGFYAVPVSQTDYELLSNDGEVRCAMDDGVEYVLRFGALTGDANGGSEDEGDSDANRYIFVAAEFNPDMIAKPELDPLPEAPADDAATDEEAADEEAADESGTDEADEAETDDTADAEEAADESGEETPETDDESADDAADELAAERERIEKENQRKQEEYDEKIADGKKKAEELNARFADWYYIISDEVYKKIHLSRDQIIKMKDAAEDEATGTGMDLHDHSGHGHGHGDHSFDPSMLEPAQPAEPEGPLDEFDSLEAEGPEGE